MREIKFRGYDAENKTMYYSNNDFHFNSPLREYDIKNAPFKINELMQFTGLKDKNRVYIYDGDIVKDDGNRYFEIIWGDYFWAIKESFFGVTGIKYNTHLRFEVIGNIYENPELLSTPTAVL